MKRLLCLVFCLVLISVSSSAYSVGLMLVEKASPARPPAASMPPPAYDLRALEITAQSAQVVIRDQVATVTIEQEVYNPQSQPREGTFLFPLPRRAQIKQFTMEIGGVPVEAELMSAEKAKGIYEEIVRKMKDPALLEYAGQDLVRLRVFPIEARGRKRLTLSYTQLLSVDSGLTEFVFPLRANKACFPAQTNLRLSVSVETRTPLKTIYSPSHATPIKRIGPNRATLLQEGAESGAAGDFQLFWAAEKNDVGMNLLTYKTGPDDGFFLLLASPGLEMQEKKVIPKDVAFVLDTSGSMAGAKLDQAKKAMAFCVANLNAEDRFEIVRFSSEAELLFSQLTTATPENCRKATTFLQAIKPTGGTAIDEALQKALALRPTDSVRPFVVVFLTDGLPTVGVTDESRIVAGVNKIAGSTRVFCFGIGHDVNTHLLDRIAESTRAITQYVLPEEDIEVKVSGFFGKIKEPVLTNLKLTFSDSIKTKTLYPTALPDLFLGEQLLVVGRYSGSGPSSITLEGMVNGKVKRCVEEGTFSAGQSSANNDHDFIPRLWATRRIGFLLDAIRLNGENKELQDEIAELARQYGIVTPYTALLILEDETRRRVPLASQSLPNLRKDEGLQMQYRSAMAGVSRDKSGELAVAIARYGNSQKNAEQASEAIAQGNTELGRSFWKSTPSRQTAVPTQTAGMVQENRYVNGRNFFQNGNQWIDPKVQQFANAPRVKVQYNSREYFALAQAHPETGPWLALGQNVMFVLNNQVYEITP